MFHPYYLIFNRAEDHADIFPEGFNRLKLEQQISALKTYEEYFSKNEIAKKVYIQAAINLIGLGLDLYYTRGANKVTSSTVDDFIKANVNPNFQQNVKNAFTSDAKVTTLTKDLTVYRYHGGTSSGRSYWYTPNQTSNPAADLALPAGNTYQYVDTYIIPKGTTILEGTVAPNFGQPGGGYQIYVPDPTVLIPK